jgi:hypothetical protein
MKRAATLLFGWVWVWMCGCDVTGPPSGARRFTPPAQYRAWWALAEACSGLRGDFNAVSWYSYPSGDVFALGGEPVNAAWYGDGNRIVLGDSEEFDGSLVRHEMLHALLRSGAHPRQQFLGNCSDIVACVLDCLDGAGGPPDTSDASRILPPALVRASILIAPDTESISADSGWVTVTVSLANTTNRPGRIQVPTYDGLPETVVWLDWRPEMAGTYEFQMDYYLTVAPVDSAGSTRRVVFNERVPLERWAQRYVYFGGVLQDSDHISPSAPRQRMTVVP